MWPLNPRGFSKHGLNVTSVRFFFPHSVTRIETNLPFYISGSLYFSRISRKERIRNVTTRQQIGLEETIKKETEQSSLYGTAIFREWQKEEYQK
jgi:16S rRNA A1518/A1519 N6-dimethyltransferase RsmA/KsgA/DIM1 with predicted DNA glycosylase/AP lyase activity